MSMLLKGIFKKQNAPLFQNRDDSDKKILTDFSLRRAWFDTFLKEKQIPLFTCPSCGYPILRERGTFEYCNICDWEDDSQDDDSADEIWGGPNKRLSLTESRLIIGKSLHILEQKYHGHINLNEDEVLDIIRYRNALLEYHQWQRARAKYLQRYRINHSRKVQHRSLLLLIKRKENWLSSFISNVRKRILFFNRKRLGID